jgi:hypothetical protein
LPLPVSTTRGPGPPRVHARRPRPRHLESRVADGTTLLLFTPLEFLEKLAALTPRPRINLVVYHGLLAPSARERARAVAHGTAAPAPDGPAAPVINAPGADASPPEVPATPPAADPSDAHEPPQRKKPRDWKWADLTRRPTSCGRFSVTSASRPNRPPPLPARPPPSALDLFLDIPV